MLRLPVRRVFLCMFPLLAAAAAAPVLADTVVSVPYKGPVQMEQIVAQGIEILAFTKVGVDLKADDGQLRWLRTRPYPVTEMPQAMAPGEIAALDANLGQYHTYFELDTTLTGMAAAHPAIAQKSVIGVSIQGRSIFALKISDNVTVDEDEPEVLYMGNHHARELMSVEIPLMFAQYLLDNYGSNATVTDYVNNREIWFIPMVNPDGHYYVQQNHSGSAGNWWRKNRRDNGNFTYGVDLNRNYAWEWGYDDIGSSPATNSEVYRGTGPFSEPETNVIRTFVNSRQFVTWFSYHSYGELLLFPWGYIYGNTPDHEVFAALGDSLVEDNGYLSGNPASGAIYITNGDSDDWGYGQQVSHPKIFAFTPEVNSQGQGGFGPAESYIQPTFDLLLSMNLKLLKFAGNPYQVVGPWTPTEYATQAPYGNGITRVSWTAAEMDDPNPTDHYELETCRDPSFYEDACTPSAPDWTMDGFSYTGSGLSGGGYFSGNANSISNSLRTRRPFFVDASSDTLEFDVNYSIENDYDYGYVDISTDAGKTWTPIAGNITTASNPHGNNRGFGFTGTSSGWVHAVFPLTAYSGQEIMLRLAYFTDGAFLLTGYTVDNVTPVPTCAFEGVIATANADTTYDHVPPQAGLWRYRVRAIDAEGQASAWSNSRDRNVATVTAADAPRTFQTSLGANYPNPFNPATQIPYVVGGVAGKSARVTLVIYDVTGARVATLADGARAPGTYLARWSGLSDRGEPVPSGIYFARLSVEGTAAQTRKLVLLK